MTAAMFQRTEIVELLKAHGANPDARDSRGMTAADAAAFMAGRGGAH
jgi:ankyrin repeat protein